MYATKKDPQGLTACDHKLEESLSEENIEAAGIGKPRRTVPHFRSTIGKTKKLTDRPIYQQNVSDMIRHTPQVESAAYFQRLKSVPRCILVCIVGTSGDSDFLQKQATLF
jgi:hypothetical protein